MVAPILLTTATVSPSERAGFWCESLDRAFRGLRTDLQGARTFEGRLLSQRAGDVQLTRLQAQGHRVTRQAAQLRASDSAAFLKIVAPYSGCAGVEQQGRLAWVAPQQWCIYDTSERYAVANPQQVEHLIVMLPKASLTERGLSLEPLMARSLGNAGGVARMALAAMRSAWHELPGMSASAAQGAGEAITQLVRLALLELAGTPAELGQHAALRARIKQHIAAQLGDPGLSVDGIAQALGCSRRQLYKAFASEAEGVAGYLLARRLQACRLALEDPRQQARSLTDIAFGYGFSNMAHFSRVFRNQLGLAPSDYRRRHAAAPGAGAT